jgi:Mn2+/Fe2+ NRAMP family transporter
MSATRLTALGPGILLFATTVGAGDLLTASLAGSEAGLAVLWAVPVGILFKFTLSEGIARWQVAAGATLLEGWISRLGRWIQWLFLLYLLLFTFVVGGALSTACGVAGTGFYQIGDPETSKRLWGVAHSLAGLLLVWWGSFRLFELLMTALVAVMFASVVLTAVLIRPDWSAVASGLVPSIPASGPAWVLGVLGGIGGTLSLLSYGYWIREQDRAGEAGLRACRTDLVLSYLGIALFGMSVVLIGSRVQLRGEGVDLALVLADQLAQALGPFGRGAFLLGFWGAVFSSVLGVWQSLPYLFVDFLRLRRGQPAGALLRQSTAYRCYLLAIATVPLVWLFRPVRQIQLLFGVLGSLFLPLLSLTLLILNNRRDWVGDRFRNRLPSNVILLLTLLFFGFLAITSQ